MDISGRGPQSERMEDFRIHRHLPPAFTLRTQAPNSERDWRYFQIGSIQKSVWRTKSCRLRLAAYSSIGDFSTCARVSCGAIGDSKTRADALPDYFICSLLLSLIGTSFSNRSR